ARSRTGRSRNGPVPALGPLSPLRVLLRGRSSGGQAAHPAAASAGEAPSVAFGEKTMRVMTMMTMKKVVRNVGTGMMGSRRTRTEAVGTIAFTAPPALARIASSQTPRTNTAIGTETVKVASTGS